LDYPWKGIEYELQNRLIQVIIMDRFEYDVTRHSKEPFSNTVYFCTRTGECHLDNVPNQELDAIKYLLNDRGKDGWELVQFNVGHEGLIAFWKRRIPDTDK
jgi:hypothetical protein